MSDAIEQRLKKFVQGLQQEHYELLHKYGYADFKLEENPVEGYEKEALWLSGVYETELAQLLNETRIEMRKYINVGYIECNGFKCRLPWCGSCSGEEEAFALSVEYEKELEKLTPKENKQ